MQVSTNYTQIKRISTALPLHTDQHNHGTQDPPTEPYLLEVSRALPFLLQAVPWFKRDLASPCKLYMDMELNPRISFFKVFPFFPKICHFHTTTTPLQKALLFCGF